MEPSRERRCASPARAAAPGPGSGKTSSAAHPSYRVVVRERQVPRRPDLPGRDGGHGQTSAPEVGLQAGEVELVRREQRQFNPVVAELDRPSYC
ncbi:MAG: hypothetical protein ACM3RP_00860 [Chitinophagales bacterium]